jgi:hypothetical protein
MLGRGKAVLVDMKDLTRGSFIRGEGKNGLFNTMKFIWKIDRLIFQIAPGLFVSCPRTSTSRFPVFGCRPLSSRGGNARRIRLLYICSSMNS